MKIFLGGTCNNSIWRDKLIPMLKIDFFNPVVENWTEECQKEEIRQREICDYCLYTITPSMKGVYSIAEAVDDVHKNPYKTIFCVLEDEIPTIVKLFNTTVSTYPTPKTKFDVSELKSLDAVGKLIERNGGKYFKSLEEVAGYLNSDNIKINTKFRLSQRLIKIAPHCDFEYKISNIINDKVEVSWVENNEELNMEYDLNNVTEFFKDGSWIRR